MTELDLHSALEVERAWGGSHRPGPNFRLAVNKIQAKKSPGLKVSKLGNLILWALSQARSKKTCQTGLG